MTHGTSAQSLRACGAGDELVDAVRPHLRVVTVHEDAGHVVRHSSEEAAKPSGTPIAAVPAPAGTVAGVVVGVIRPGYLIAGDVLRPAAVAVSA